MSTPQDPRDSGETPEEKSTDRPESDSGATGRPAADYPRESPDEPFLTPGAPQRPDTTQTPAQAPEPPEGGASPGTPEPLETAGPSDAQGAGSHDPPTEYLPKLLGRESRPAGRAAGPDQPIPEPDKGSAAYEYGWQPGAQSSGGEVPPQAWSARPEEQSPGQAWQQQSPGGQQQGGSPYPPQGEYPPQGGYGGGTEQPGGGYGGRSGWNTPQQPGWGGQEQQGWGAQEQQGWGGQEQQGRGGQEPQPGWGGQEQPGWNAPEQQGWGGAPGAQQGWSGSGAAGGQQGWPGTGAPGGQQGPGGWPGGTPGPGGYPAYPEQQQYQPYDATRQPERSGPQILSIIGFVCAAVSLLFCPIVFGAAGIVLGVVGHIRGEPLGKWAAIAAAICLVVGVAIGLLLTGTEIVPNESFG